MSGILKSSRARSIAALFTILSSVALSTRQCLVGHPGDALGRQPVHLEGQHVQSSRVCGQKLWRIDSLELRAPLLAWVLPKVTMTTRINYLQGRVMWWTVRWTVSGPEHGDSGKEAQSRCRFRYKSTASGCLLTRDYRNRVNHTARRQSPAASGLRRSA